MDKTSAHRRPRRARPPSCATLLGAAGLCLALGAQGAPVADVVVRVGGIGESRGLVGCALFGEAGGFPLDIRRARTLWQPATPAGVTCRFERVPEGRMAVSVVHDLNGNREVDTNVFGLPLEPWAVSRQARPALRAPRFDEASFTVTAGGADVVIEIQVAR